MDPTDHTSLSCHEIMYNYDSKTSPSESNYFSPDLISLLTIYDNSPSLIEDDSQKMPLKATTTPPQVRLCSTTSEPNILKLGSDGKTPRANVNSRFTTISLQLSEKDFYHSDESFFPIWANTNFSIPPSIYSWCLDEFCTCILKRAVAEMTSAYTKEDVATIRFQAACIKYASLTSAALRLSVYAEKLQKTCDFYIQLTITEDPITIKEYLNMRNFNLEGVNFYSQRDLFKIIIEEAYSDFIQESFKIFNLGENYLSSYYKNEFDPSTVKMLKNLRLKSRWNFQEKPFYNIILQKIFSLMKAISSLTKIGASSSKLNNGNNINRIKKHHYYSFDDKIHLDESDKRLNSEYSSSNSSKPLSYFFNRLRSPNHFNDTQQTNNHVNSDRTQRLTFLGYLKNCLRYIYYISLILYIISAWCLPLIVIPLTIFISICYYISRLLYFELIYLYKKLLSSKIIKKQLYPTITNLMNTLHLRPNSATYNKNAIRTTQSTNVTTTQSTNVTTHTHSNSIIHMISAVSWYLYNKISKILYNKNNKFLETHSKNGNKILNHSHNHNLIHKNQITQGHKKYDNLQFYTQTETKDYILKPTLTSSNSFDDLNLKRNLSQQINATNYNSYINSDEEQLHFLSPIKTLNSTHKLSDIKRMIGEKDIIDTDQSSNHSHHHHRSNRQNFNMKRTRGLDNLQSYNNRHRRSLSSHHF